LNISVLERKLGVEYMTNNKKVEFDEVNVKRMNIVDEDGTIRMALSNKERFPPPFVIDGKPVGREGLPMAGITFYNDEGFECGALHFGSDKNEKDGPSQQVGLSFDPYYQNDAIDLGITEKDGKRDLTLDMYDQPNFPITDIAEILMNYESASDEKKRKYIKELEEREAFPRKRISINKGFDGAAEIKLFDSKGNPRIRMAVDSNDIPRLEFLDQQGKVIDSFLYDD